MAEFEIIDDLGSEDEEGSSDSEAEVLDPDEIEKMLDEVRKERGGRREGGGKDKGVRRRERGGKDRGGRIRERGGKDGGEGGDGMNEE